MQCPKCRLLNPPSAERCDCGYDFQSKTVKQSYVAAAEARKRDQPSEIIRDVGRREQMVGAIVAGLGIAATVGTYAYATQNGGTYVVTYGAILYGVVRWVRGYDMQRSGIVREFWGPGNKGA